MRLCVLDGVMILGDPQLSPISYGQMSETSGVRYGLLQVFLLGCQYRQKEQA